MREIKPIPLKKLAKGLSTVDKIKYGILYLRISKKEVIEMKQILKDEAGGIIAEIEEPKMSILRPMEKYLEVYIDGLSKKDTLKLYMAYLEVKEALDSAQAQYAKFEFLARLYQIYAKEGWTARPTGNLAKSIRKFKESATVKTVLGDKSAPVKKPAKKAVFKKKVSRKSAKARPTKKKSRK
jgi:hypothetical protein